LPELVESLRAAERADPVERIALEVRWAGVAGLGRVELQMRLASTPKATEAALTKLLGARAVIRFDRERGAVVHKDVLDELRARMLAVVDAFHGAFPLKPGMPREALRSQLPPALSPRLFHLAMESLVDEGALAADRELARRPGHSVAEEQRARGLAPSVERVATLYRESALTPPRPAEVVAKLQLDEPAVKSAIELLARGGTLVRITDLHFDRSALDALRGRLVAFLREKKQITAQEWKDLVGATRKFTIPLAEYFDAEKVTLRVGEIRKLRGS
jgi:selenocysteine-specific elongation factor